MGKFGDGSDGALNVTSGTHNLALNKKWQFTTVNVSAGATLSTNSTTGSVLYIAATQSITINGTINVSNKVANGNNSWSVTIDGTTYTSPGVANGGNGSKYVNQGGSLQSNGFGGGGGGESTTTNGNGGFGGNGSSNGGSGGGSALAVGTTMTTQNWTYVNGNNGGNSAGGSGFTNAIFYRASGNIEGKAYAASGAGGNSYGQNGQDAVPPWYEVVSGSGSASWGGNAGGGGGAGGNAGKAGVHVVLIAPTITVNGTVITSGSAGTNGGKGGRGIGGTGIVGGTPTFVWRDYWGGGGGGGGGGRAGNVTVRYATSLSDSGTYTMNAGSGGTGGTGGPGNATPGQNGSAGSAGSKSAAQTPPDANFTATNRNGARPLSVAFNNLSLGADSYYWDFGDGTDSTDANPVKTYSSVGSYDVTLTATNEAGSNVYSLSSYVNTTINSFDLTAGGTMALSGGADRTAYYSREAGGGLVFGGSATGTILRDVQAIEEKRYLYKVYDEDGSYIETWKDVVSLPEFTAEINSLGSTMNVELARNSDSLSVLVSPLQTEAGTDITAESGEQLLVSTESRNQIGPGSSVQHNNRADVYVFYGSVEPLLTEDEQEITTEDGEVLLASIGAPNGRRIFTGFISEINSRYGSSETTLLQLTSYGFDLGQFVLTSGSDTTVAYNSTDPSAIALDAMAKFQTQSSAYDTYTVITPDSVTMSGTVVSYAFRANTYAESLKKILELLPAGWYFYVDLGDNTVYIRPKPSSPAHTFVLGKHIKALDLKSSILDVKNDVYFTGGGDPALFVRTEEPPAPRTRKGLSMYYDSRVTLQDSAETISEGIIDEDNQVRYRTSVEILTKVYDIESIKVGDTVTFRNFGNYVDSLVMQVMGINYSPDSVILALDTLPPTVNKRLEDLRRNQLVAENQNVPNSPS